MAGMKKESNHPCERPTSLYHWCINYAPPSQTILDPFMGSGTTLRAAKDLGRKAYRHRDRGKVRRDSHKTTETGGVAAVRICKMCDDEYEGPHLRYCQQCIYEIMREVDKTQEQQKMANE